MRPQVRGLAEGGRALPAREGLLAAVHALVDGERGAVREGLAALVALVRLVARVHPLVDLHRLLALVLRPAHAAGEGPQVRVGVQVLLDVEAAEALAADGAPVAPVLVVPLQVHGQVRRPAETLAADGAHVRLLALVHEAVVRGQHALVHEVGAADGADVLADAGVHLVVLRPGRLGLVRPAALLARPRALAVAAGPLSQEGGCGEGDGIMKYLKRERERDRNKCTAAGIVCVIHADELKTKTPHHSQF